MSCGCQNKRNKNSPIYGDNDLSLSKRLNIENKFIQQDHTDKNIQLFAEAKKISLQLSRQFFNAKCLYCEFQLTVTEIAMNLKLFYSLLLKYPNNKKCKKCLIEEGFNIEQWNNLVSYYRENCSWF